MRKPRFYHWWIYYIFMWTWNPIFRDNEKLRWKFIKCWLAWEYLNSTEKKNG